MADDPRGVFDDDGFDEAADLFRRPTGPRRASGCPPPELLQAVQTGVLPAELHQQVTKHVDHCSMCRALSDALSDPSVGTLTAEESERILQRVHAGGHRPPLTDARSRLRLLVGAAAAIVLVTGSVVVWISRSAPPAVVVPAPGTRQIPLAAAPPIFRLEKPKIVVAASRAQSPESAELAEALKSSASNDFAEASRRLRALILRHPRSAAGYFHLGVSELFLYRDGDAVVFLESAERLVKDDPTLAGEIAWYLALAYRRSDRAEQARARLGALCRGAGNRSARACEGLREIATPTILSGVVTGPDGLPLEGVSVGEYVVRWAPDVLVAFQTRFASITDANGRFSVSGQLISPSPNMIVSASKPGYFSEAKVVPPTREMKVDLVLEPWVHIPFGETVSRTIKPGDRTCGDPTELCHRFAVELPGEGTLEVSVDSSSRSDLDLHVEAPNGETYGPRPRAPLHLAMPAAGRSTYQIRVLSYANAPRDFKLTTRLR